MAKTLLIVGGGKEALPGIQLAKDLGLYVVVSDKNPQAPGFKIADDHLVACTYTPDETAAAAQAYHKNVRSIDGVMCLAADVPHTVAAVSELLSLPGIPRVVADRAINKLAMKQKFQQDGIPIPYFKAISSIDELRLVIAEQGYPLVLKPIDSRGSRGVIRMTEAVDVEWAYAHSMQWSPTDRIMVEKFLPGPQVSTESIVIDGVAYTPGFSDRNYEFLEKYAPYFIENGGSLPSKLSQEQQEAIKQLIDEAARSLGVVNGVVKGDVVVHEGKPYIIELAARLSGGYFCTHEIPLNTGVSTIKAVIELALGEKPDPADLEPKFQRPVAQRYMFPAPGKVVAVSGVEEARALPGVMDVVVDAKVGDIVEEPSNGTFTQGMVMTVGETIDEAIANAEAAINTVKIETE